MNFYCCHKHDCPDVDCPGRPNGVAKIGHRYPRHPQPVVLPFVNRHLKALAKWMLIAILGWLVWIPLLYLLLRE